MKDKPAFPRAINTDHPTYLGMTLREYYAGLAMQGLLRLINKYENAGGFDWDASKLSEYAAEQADALIAELQKEQG